MQGEPSVVDWKTYAGLGLLALVAGCFRWPDLIKDKEGKSRWGVLFLQIPTAGAIAVTGHAAIPLVYHFLPYAGQDIGYLIVGVAAFVGPIAFTKIFDAIADGIRRRVGGG